MVDVRYKARLGNNLFQYALGRVIAERLEFELRADPIPGFPNTANRVAGARHEGPEQILTGQTVNMESLSADRGPRRIVLDGWFQRYEYYRPHRAEIREWLQFDAGIPAPQIRPAVVVNVRRTDYVQLGWALPYSFYQDALRQLQVKDAIWIVTDDPHDPFFHRFDWPIRFFQGNALEQMRFMSCAQQLVMSQSTFSWWPTFLGDPDVVVCPDPSFGVWAPDGDQPETMLIERDRFVCLPCAAPYQPTPVEERYQARRLFRRRVILALNRRLGTAIAVPPN